MNQKQFIEEVFEIAYGENAINRNFTFEEVIETLREFSDNALIFEESGLTREELENLSEISQESYKKGYIDRKKDELLKKC
jgi:lipoate-protein ligase A